MSRSSETIEHIADIEKVEELHKKFKECMEATGGAFSSERMVESYPKCKHYLDESRKIVNKRLTRYPVKRNF